MPRSSLAPSCQSPSPSPPDRASDVPAAIHPILLTQSGNLFHLAVPAHSILSVEDIAHALANLCRFGGHTRAFYSYAQHAVIVSSLVPPEHALAALLHDAPKAILGNVQTALKPLLPDYRALEERVLCAIHQSLHLPWPAPTSIEPAALTVRATERRDLLPPHPAEWPELHGVDPLPAPIIPLPPERARKSYLRRYAELTAQQVRTLAFG